MADLEARALWHLEIGYPPPGEVAPALDDDYDGEYLGHVTCWHCGDEGSVVVCLDDLCIGADHCMHGDGDEMCRVCHGEGFL